MVGPVIDFAPHSAERLEVRLPVDPIDVKEILRRARVVALRGQDPDRGRTHSCRARGQQRADQALLGDRAWNPESRRSAGWGAKVVDRLAADLRRELPDMTGFSPRNLRYMRDLARAWPDEAMLPQAVAKLPWGHIRCLLDKLDNPTDRLWYANQAVENGWSRSVLEAQIATNLRGRQGAALTSFDHALPAPDSELVRDTIKDPTTSSSSPSPKRRRSMSSRPRC